jgi:hypothetical protein
MKEAPVLHWPKLFEGWMLVSAYRRFGDGNILGDGLGGGFTSPRANGNGTGDGESTIGWGDGRGGRNYGTGYGDVGSPDGGGYGRSV